MRQDFIIKMNKKGVSPVIATILLVALVVGLATIVFIWFRSFTQEAATKGGQNIQNFCSNGEIQFDAEYVGGQLSISNNGNVPIYSFSVKIDNAGGGYSTKDMSLLAGSNWPTTGLNQGDTFQGSLSGVSSSSATDIVLIPVLRGSVSGGKVKLYTCSDSAGYKVSL